MSVNNTILEKLRKILALANDKAAQPGEIEAAMAKARAIAMENQIDLAQVSFANPGKKAGPEINKGEANSLTKTEQPFHRYLYWILDECLGVVVIRRGAGAYYGGVYFIGEATDVAMAQEIFKWLSVYMPKAFYELYKAGTLQKTSGDINGFYRGLALGVIASNKRVEKETLAKAGVSSAQWGLVVRNKQDAIEAFKAEMFPNLSKARQGSGRQQNKMAGALGYLKGRSLKLNQLGDSQGNAKQVGE